MPVVGSAWVVIKAATTGLDDDIAKKVNAAIAKAAAKVDASKVSERIGKSITDGIIAGVDNANLADRINASIEQATKDSKKTGEAIGTEVADGVEDGLDKSNLPKKVTDSVTEAADKAKDKTRESGTRVGEELGDSVSDGFETRSKSRFGPALMRIGQSMTNSVAQIGMKMATSMAAPIGLVFGVGGYVVQAVQVASAYIGQLITLTGTLGPALLAAGAAGGAGLFMIISGAAAVILAFKTQSAELDAFKASMTALGPQFKEIGLAAQRGLFGPLEEAVNKTIVTIPTLASGMEKVGAAMGGVANKMADMVSSADNLARISALFDGATPTIGATGSAMANLAESTLIATAAASGLIQRFMEWIATVTQAWLATIELRESTGELGTFMTNMGDRLAQLGAIFGSVFGGLGNILAASAAEGQNLLDRMELAAARFEAWTASVGGQNKMAEFFANSADIVQVFNGVIAELGRALGRIVLEKPENLMWLAQALYSLIPVIEQSAPIMSDFAVAISQLLVSMANSGALGAFLSLMTGLVNLLNTLVNIPFAGEVVAWGLVLVPIIGVGTKLLAVGKMLIPVFRGLYGVFLMLRVPMLTLRAAMMALSASFLATPVGWVVAGIVALVAALVLAYNKVPEFREAVQEAFTKVKDAVTEAVAYIRPILEQVWDRVKQTVESLMPVFQTVFSFLGKYVQFYVGFVLGYFKVVFGAVATVVRALWPVVSAVFSGIARVIGAVVGAIWPEVQAMFENIKTAFAAVSGFFSKLFGDGDGAADGARSFGDTVMSVFSRVSEVIIGFGEKVAPFATAFFDTLAKVASTVLPIYFAVVKGIFTAVFKIIGGVMMAIVAIIKAAWSVIVAVVRFATDTLWPAIQTAFENIRAIISGVMTAVISVVSTAWSIVSGVVQTVTGFIWPIIQTVFNAISAVISTVMSVISAVVGVAWSAISAAVRFALDYIWPAIQAVFSGISSFISSTMAVVLGVVSTVWSAISVVVQLVARAIWAVIKTVFDAILLVITTVMRAIQSVVMTVWNAIWAFVTTVVNAIRSVIETVFNAIQTVISVIMNAINLVITTIWNAILTAVRFVLDALRFAVDNAFNVIRTVISTIMNAIMGVVMTIWSTISGIWNGAISAIRDTTGSVMEAVRQRFSDALERIKSLFSSAVEAIGGIWNRVTDIVKSPIRAMFEWINNNMISPLNSVIEKFAPDLSINPLPMFHSGGYTGSQIKGREGMALLRNDEFVSDPAATARNRAALEAGNNGARLAVIGDAINAGRLGFGIGGPFDAIGDLLADLTSLVARGAKFALSSIANPGLDALQSQFGGSWSGDFVIGGMRKAVDGMLSWGDARDAEAAAKAAAAMATSMTTSSAPYIGPSSGILGRPLAIYSVTSEFGPRGGAFHAGIDLGAPSGTPIMAAAAGLVTQAGWNDGYGNYAAIDHGGGLRTTYGHMSALASVAGQILAAGQVLGYVGSTGDSTGPHLHFETYQNGGAVNPRQFVGFDRGGWLNPGLNMTYNGTGKPEPVFTDNQWRMLSSAVDVEQVARSSGRTDSVRDAIVTLTKAMSERDRRVPISVDVHIGSESLRQHIEAVQYEYEEDTARRLVGGGW